MGSKSKIKIGKAEAQAFAASLKDVKNISEAWWSDVYGALRYAHAMERRHKKTYTQEKLFAVARTNLFSLLRRRGVEVKEAKADPKHQELGAGTAVPAAGKGAGCGAGCKCVPTPVVHFPIILSSGFRGPACGAGIDSSTSDDSDKVTCVECLRLLVNKIDAERNNGDSVILSLKKQLDAEKNRANVLEHELLNVRVALLRTTEAHEATALALNAART